MKRQQGFTLIEAAVAIAVVAILSGIIAPLVVKNIKDAQTARAKNEVQVIAAAIAAQMRDLGARPSLAGGGTMGTGLTDNAWASAGAAATFVTPPTLGATNAFCELFSGYPIPTVAVPNPVALTAANINAAWGAVAGAEFSWKGPYMSLDVANKSNPWGGKYYIFGYNANGQTNNTPIWVVCPGPDNTIDTTLNPVATSLGLNQTWVQVAGSTSLDDIAVRVN